ncbi:PAS domain-containing sensor histidine kinase [Bordetella genomosp. 8]|uniref:Sensor protein FixL n=1 Tax=Bordetella genomosp. 8 TaxID=1416806 RepID=A0A1W6YLE0_9BORD|nr:PAS domain S-box protein [Bordetella genomosp. 8]ARP81882.1 PAS domain-containing sensor histidine kinase [Bordetella genomosp. 8]
MKDHLLESQTLDWLIRSAKEAIVITDAQGRILIGNSATARLFGHPVDGLGGVRLNDILPDVTLGERVGDGDPAAGDPAEVLEVAGRRADGSTLPVEICISPLATHWGLKLHMISIRDIRARKQAEQAVRDNEARLRAVFDTAVDAIVTIDEQGRIERFNPAAVRVFGYTEDEVMGRNVSMLMPSPYREMHDRYLDNYLDTGEKKIIGIGREVLGMRKGGAVFPMDLAVAEMRVGDRRMFTGMVRDITERKRAEARYAELLREVTSANEELTNFAYIVSHDLKAPLRGISSLANWLVEDYADRLDDEGREHLRLLVGRVHRMSGLIDGILEYSRIGRIKEARVSVDLDVLVREIVDLLAPPPHIEVRVEDPLPVVHADRTRMQQLFQNLLSNAIKYMDKPEGVVRISCEPAGERWRFAVADNGPGIEERHHERIFQLFQTLAPRDRIESTGVGLTLVKKIVEMYGSEIYVQSVLGAGTTFSFTLPILDANPTPAEPEMPS